MTYSMKKILQVLAPTAALVSVPALAAPVTQWGFNVDSVWENVVSEDGACSVPGNCSNFTITDTVVSWADDDGDASSVVLGNTPAVGTVLTVGFDGVTVNTAGAVGVSNNVTHNNNPLNGGTNSLDSVQLTASVILTPITPANPALGVQMFEFPIEFLETPNDGGDDGLCEDGLPDPAAGCEDIFIIDGGLLNRTFTYDGFDYFVNIFPTDASVFSLLEPGECQAAGASSDVCVGFITEENDSTTFDFGFTISSEPLTTDVPVPGTLALFGLGLLGLSRIRRS